MSGVWTQPQTFTGGTLGNLVIPSAKTVTFGNSLGS
jgi:hypothetical protein